MTHLEGALRQISSSGSDANLLGWIGPPGNLASDAPNRTVYTIVHTFAGTYADLAINTDGSIWLIPSSNTNTAFVSLEGISYQNYPYMAGAGCPLAPRYCVQPLVINTTNWTAAGFGAGLPGAYEEGNQAVVHLQGGVRQWSTAGSTPKLIGHVPASLDPPHNVYTIVHTFARTYADLDIFTDGSIWLIPSLNTNTAFVSLEGITYSLSLDSEDTSGAISLNETNWSSSGAAGPGWYQDIDGVVHLTGAVSQVSASGSPNLIGTLDATARPTRTVYTIVQTGFGTYADLAINPQGQIGLIPATGLLAPGVPAQTNPAFVSLDGVTFLP